MLMQTHIQLYSSFRATKMKKRLPQQKATVASDIDKIQPLIKRLG